MDLPDLDQFRPDGRLRLGHQEPDRRPRRKVKGWFILGPLSGEWFTQAAGLSGAAVRVGLALWYLKGLKKRWTVKPTWATWRRFSLCPDTARSGLKVLEDAGLVTVVRPAGCTPVVTIEEVSAKDQTGSHRQA